MSENALEILRVARVSNLTADIFVSEYLVQNRPVVITDAMNSWPALGLWGPAYFAEKFGDEPVQVYDDLFRLIGIAPLSQYLDQYFGKDGLPTGTAPPKLLPYVRWYCHLSSETRVPWADEVFDRLAGDWSRPECFPRSSFALPVCGPDETVDPSRDWFPAKGLFISPRGARTRLHADPWCSDALLCQIYGKKDFVMYEPSQAGYLTNGQRTVDVEKPDTQIFPSFYQASPTVRDTLEPGEILLVPAGWYHHFKSSTDSISLTWNFVHLSRLSPFLAYLAAGPKELEVQQLAYAYFESPRCRPVDRAGFLAGLLKPQPTAG